MKHAKHLVLFFLKITRLKSMVWDSSFSNSSSTLKAVKATTIHSEASATSVTSGNPPTTIAPIYRCHSVYVIRPIVRGINCGKCFPGCMNYKVRFFTHYSSSLFFFFFTPSSSDFSFCFLTLDDKDDKDYKILRQKKIGKLKKDTSKNKEQIYLLKQELSIWKHELTQTQKNC